jgi:hypothetical protein
MIYTKRALNTLALGGTKKYWDFLPWDSINVQFDNKDEERCIWERIVDSFLKFWINKLGNPKIQM